MSGPFGSSQWMYASGGFYPYEIDQSVRFNLADSAYLSRTPASAGNRKTWTWSGWVKRGELGRTQHIFAGGGDSNNITQALFRTGDQLRIQHNDGGSQHFRLDTTAVFRDTSAWYHFVVAVDTTQATDSNRVKLYVNGEQVTAFDTSTWPSLNKDLDLSSGLTETIGARVDGFDRFDGYLAEVNFIDGTALDPTSFGETKAGIWIPKDYTGSYGTNGFKLAFQDSAALGDDTSGNGNDFTANNLAASDQMLDTPVSNFMTFNPLNRSGSSVSFAEGNLRFNSGGTGGPPFNYAVAANFSGSQATGGKYYWEWYCVESGFAAVGIFDSSVAWDGGSKIGGDGPVVYYAFDGNFANQAARVAYGNTFTDGDLIGCAVDFDNRKIWFSKNGTWQNSGDPAAGTGEAGTFADEEYFLGYVEAGSSTDLTKIILNAGQDSTFAGAITAGGNADANGIGDFKYTVPSGYLALCAANLPDPGIDPAADETPEDYFNTVTWSKTGADNSAITISGVGFEPDLVWAKGRSASMSHQWYDIVRGTGEGLSSDSTGAEVNNNTSGYISSFNTDGFTASPGSADNFYFNYQSGYTYVAWNWKAGGTAVSNTDGSVTSSVSASPESGFSAVSYTGSNVGITAGHGLSSAPEMIIWKARGTPNSSARHWIVWHKDLTSTDYILYLSLTNAQTNVTAGSVLASSPTSTLFSLGTEPSVNWNSENYIAYCFHSVDGYSKVGSYTGNGSTDGPMVYTGFRPAWVMIKATGSTGGASNWRVVDSVRNTFNPEDKHLQPNTSDVEDTGSGAGYIDFLSNGFKIRTTALQLNSSGVGFIYLAFAEQPTKYANAR